MNTLIPTDASLFFSRHDASDPRLTERSDFFTRDEATLSSDTEVAILGYPDDEGVKLNGGRVGAAHGPTEIRRWLYKTTPHPQRRQRKACDVGDLLLAGSLDERHALAKARVHDLLGRGTRVLSFGGGNDWAYPDGLAFLERFKDAQPVIINVDAHLDVRPFQHVPHSGTPFYRLLESGIPFDFVEFGIQTHLNATAHWTYARKRGARILTLDEMLDAQVSLLEYTTQRLNDLLVRPRPCFLAIDIDAFALPWSAGSSAGWPLGLSLDAFWPVFQFWLKRFDVRVLGIYEVAPPLDAGTATVKWAAQLAHGFLHDV